MKTRPLGTSGLVVGQVGLGAMPLSLADRPAEADAVRVLHAAFDAGITLVDTADAYCLDDKDLGHNERLISKALRSWPGARETVVLATKAGCARPKGAWTCDGHPAHIKAACEKSLKALGVEAIALYQFHAPDDKVPFEDSVGAFAELRKAGKVRHVGLSNVSAAQIKKAEKIVPLAGVQNRCSPFHREDFLNGVVALCEERGLAYLPYSPVGGHGGHVRTSQDPVLKDVAARRNVTPYQVCLAWLLAVSPAMIPIPGASKASSALSSAAAADLALAPEDLADLARAFPTRP